MCKAIEVAGWFLNNDIEPSNTKSGNLRLNKLLYFAQMISLVKRNKPLFDEEIYAFENGVVVEEIRCEYQRNYFSFVDRAKSIKKNFTNEENDVLNITKLLFEDASAKELSDLTHEHKCWKDFFEKSIKSENKNGYKYNKEDSIIPIAEILNNYQEDLDLVRNMVYSLEDNIIDEDVIEVNNIKFFYNPNEIDINEDVLRVLQCFPGSDTAYTLYMDESQGLIIY